MFKSQEKQKLSKVQILVIVAFIQTRNSRNQIGIRFRIEFNFEFSLFLQLKLWEP